MAAVALLASACGGHGADAVPTRTRGPYLQLVTSRSATVVWDTSAPAPCTVRVAAAGAEPRSVVGRTATICVVALDGLTPGTAYAYTVEAGPAAVAAPATFRTDDPARTTFSFAVVGDSGSGSPDQRAVAERMLAAQPDFVLSTGDMVYENGAAADFDGEFFAPYRELLARVVFWPVLGNHDVRTAHGAPWREAFVTPANNPAHEEGYYSFDWGTAHVVVLDSNADASPGSPQGDFLDHDLSATSARWTFVAFHHAIYSTGTKHGSKLDLRAAIVPVLDRHRVDVVFNGHNHIYERTKPLRADAVVEPGAGTVYVTTGGGGKELQGVGPPAEWTAHSERAFHFTRVAVDGDEIRLQMVRADGSVGDDVAWRKASADR